MACMFGVAEGFRPKAVQGIMANYCAACGFHLDLHGSRWVPQSGSIRTCPPAAASKPSLQDTSGEAHAPLSPMLAVLQPLTTPFGTETCYEQLSPRRSKKVGANTPQDSMSGATVVRNEPAVYVQASSYAPKGSLSGSGVQSSYDERQEWVSTKAIVKQPETHLMGPTFVPLRSESPKPLTKRRDTRGIIW